VKTLSICALLCLLSILAKGGISDALSGAGLALPETPAARSVSAPVPAPASDGSKVVADFAEYVHLHNTRSEGISHAASGMKACTE
jgi:hypothetical protein